MRIAVFTNTYLPTINGVVNSIEAFRQGLEALGHTVYVFAPDPPCAGGDREGVFRYPSISPKRADYPLAIPFRRERPRAMGRIEIDIVHTQHPWLVASWGQKYALRHGIPVVTTVHTQYEQYAHYARPIPPSWLRGPLRWSVKRHCERCTVVVTPGVAMRGYLAELGIENVEVVPNATDLSGYETADGSEVRRQFGAAEGEILFTFIGRTAREKSLDILIAAFARIADDLPSSRLLIVGGGAALEETRALAAAQPCAARILVPGPVPYANIKQYHAAADVFAIASVTEVQPLSLNEAMAARTPIAGFDTRGVNDMVGNGETGLLAPESDGVDGLARVMLELGRDTDLRRRMGAAAQQAASRYHIPVATQRLVEVYESVLSGR